MYATNLKLQYCLTIKGMLETFCCQVKEKKEGVTLDAKKIEACENFFIG